MRFICSIIFLVVSAMVCGEARAQWHEEIFSDLGVAKEFPAQSVSEEGTYQTIVIGEAPVAARFISAAADGVALKITIADMRAPDLVVKGANAMGECYFDAELEGDVLSNLAYRLEDGTRYGIHGRIVDVVLDEDVLDEDVLDEDGGGVKPGRKKTGCFFAKGRLFKTEALLGDGAGQEALDVASRFVRSMRFDVGDIE
nr:MAG: hypothetical protein E4H34_04610 [Hyphomicrobiales bacterium]